MKPYEIADRLKKGNTTVLTGLRADDEFWFPASLVMNPNYVLPDFKIPANPSEYGAGAPDGIFEKILTSELPQNSIFKALSAFVAACTKREWEDWYKPILEYRLDLNITTDVFSNAAPSRYYIRKNLDLTFQDITAVRVPSQFWIEPLMPKSSLTHWFIWNNGIPA